MISGYKHLEPFLSAEDVDAMVSIAQSLGSFGTYADEATSEGLGEDLPQRFDMSGHYRAQGMTGEGNLDNPDTASSRNNYFRETAAFDARRHAPLCRRVQIMDPDWKVDAPGVVPWHNRGNTDGRKER